MERFHKFPAGEVHTVDPYPYYYSGLTEDSRIIYIPRNEYYNLNDWIFQNLLVTDLAKRNLPSGVTLSLFLPYLPYSRQDRRTSKHEPFSLKVLGDILNLQSYHSVITLDVHSDVAFGCINNLYSIPAEGIIKTFFSLWWAGKTIVIPDQGAYKRLSNLPGEKVICIKERNTVDGSLKIKEVVGNVKGKDCIIVDDICDGGGTFILLAKELYKKGAKSVELYVTHGIFSKGYQPLLEAGITKFYMTNSMGNCSAEWDQRVCIDVLEVVRRVD